MAKAIPNVRFELHKVYRTYVDQLLMSGNIANVLLENSDISAAGGQIEGALRNLLTELLPERVKVSHGHIVDTEGNVSYQQDVLIADSFFSKSLIKTLDGTEFYPYESIFITAEVKKTWSYTKLESAVKSIKHNKDVLTRYSIPSNVIETGSKFVGLSSPITTNTFRNPLFSFSFSLDYDKTFKPSHFAEVYLNKETWKYLPNVSVVLNHGIYLLIDVDEIDKGEFKIKLYPEFVEPDDNCAWVFLKLAPEETLAYLVFMLIQHINDTVLEKVSILNYSKTMLEVAHSNITPVK